MTGISKAGVYLSVIDLLAKKNLSAHARSRTAENTILDAIRGTDSKKADELDKRLNENKQVVEQLQNGKLDQAKSRKAAAAEKVRRIKEEIQMLKRMGGDPKVIARQIARLARDLKAAAREYASAGGTSPQDRTASADVATGSSDNDVTASNTVESGTTDRGTAVPADVSVTTVSGETSVSREINEKRDDTTQRQDSALTTATGAALAEGALQYQETERQKIKDNLQKEVAKIKEKTSEAEADREFAGEVSTLVAKLKILAKQMKQRLHQVGESAANQDINQTDRALAEVEEIISDITRRTLGTMINSCV